MSRSIVHAMLLSLAACGAPDQEEFIDRELAVPERRAIDAVATEYVHLVLALGEHDDGYVDAYFGPPEWRQAVRAETPALPEILERALAARAETAGRQGDEAVRSAFLGPQLLALETRARMLQGASYDFDEESALLYGAVAPSHTEAYFQERLERLETLLPGDADLPTRVEAFRDRFTIPAERLDAVFRAAIAECRRRTLGHIALPPQESFRLEYVIDKPWSGYNWYQGGYESLIEVNTELPIRLERAIDLACHEGYPGHHTYNALREWHLVDERGWVEHSVYPLYSPLSLIAEGSANYGIRLAFPGEERARFEADALAPLAGIDPGSIAGYYEVLEALDQISFAGNEAARSYLDGKIEATAAIDWLQRFALYSPDRAAQRLRFIDTYRSYVINYNLGEQLVREWVERDGSSEEERWARFADLVASPRLPADL